MRIKHLLYLLLALPLAFVACNDPEEPAPEKEAVLTLTSEATMNFPAEGGEGVITYIGEIKEVTRNFPVPAASIEAYCEADWVTDFAVDESIKFTVLANEGDAREAEIVVKFGGDEAFKVAVKQVAKGEEPEPEYVMDVELAAAMRIPSSELDLADNYFVLAFVDDAENVELGIVLVGAEGETILQAGDYVNEDGSFMAEGCELYVYDTDGYYRFTDGVTAVALDGEDYTLDIELLSEAEELYHFTYAGPILDMEPETPEGPVAFVPEKVVADKWEAGNFMLQLYFENGTRYHELDMYDEVNPNDNYLSEGVYKYNDGSIGTWSVYSNGLDTTCSLSDAEITISHNDDKSVTLVGYIISEEGDHITIDWTGVVEGFNFDVETPAPGGDVEFVAAYFGGTHYNVGNHNYYIVLSDNEVDGGTAVDGGTYYYFDLYSDEADENLTVPNGVYTFDTSNSNASGTFTEEYSYGFKVNGTERIWYLYAEGSKVTVTDNKIVAELVLSDGTKHTVTYEGDLSLASMAGGGLTSDLDINFTNAVISANYYGDYYSSTTDNYFVEIYENADAYDTGTGRYIILDLLADFATAVDHSGTFVGSDTLTPNTFVPGFLEEGYLMGCWYAEIEEGVISGVMAPMMEGTVTVTLNSDGTQLIELDCVDDQGYKITGRITDGPSVSSAQRLAAGSKSHRTMRIAKGVVR